MLRIILTTIAISSSVYLYLWVEYARSACESMAQGITLSNNNLFCTLKSDARYSLRKMNIELNNLEIDCKSVNKAKFSDTITAKFNPLSKKIYITKPELSCSIELKSMPHISAHSNLATTLSRVKIFQCNNSDTIVRGFSNKDHVLNIQARQLNKDNKYQSFTGSISADSEGIKVHIDNYQMTHKANYVFLDGDVIYKAHNDLYFDVVIDMHLENYIRQLIKTHLFEHEIFIALKNTLNKKCDLSDAILQFKEFDSASIRFDGSINFKEYPFTIDSIQSAYLPVFLIKFSDDVQIILSEVKFSKNNSGLIDQHYGRFAFRNYNFVLQKIYDQLNKCANIAAYPISRAGQIILMTSDEKFMASDTRTYNYEYLNKKLLLNNIDMRVIKHVILGNIPLNLLRSNRY